VFKSSDASAHTGGDDTNASPSSSSASSAHGHNSNKGMHPNHTKGGSSTHKTSSSSSSKLPHNHTSDTRPFHKVILLCGAPGTGKVSCHGNLGAFKDDREGVR